MHSKPRFAASHRDATPLALSPEMRTALIATFVWINASEVFRYFVFVMPMTRAAMAQVTDPAPMNVAVFLVWGFWDTLLVACVSLIAWLYFERFGGGIANIAKAATLLWATIFGVFWMATWNMNMTKPAIALTALPLAWIEMVVATAILEHGWRRTRERQH